MTLTRANTSGALPKTVKMYDLIWMSNMHYFIAFSTDEEMEEREVKRKIHEKI